MIRLELYDTKFYNDLNSYELSEEQAKFTASIDYCVNERKDTQDPHKTIVVIVENSTAIGFFVLDRGDDKYGVTDNHSAMLIRSLSVNPAYQGKGVGTQAMILLDDFVQQHFPDSNELVLSVNCKNNRAYHMYLKADFSDTGRTIMGIMGEQNVMSKELKV